MRLRERHFLAVAAIAILAASGCAASNTAKGAAVGAAAGGAVGAVIGNQTGSTARGAIIGAAVGGAAGAIIGHNMDERAKELEKNVPGATVQRVGEGIAVTFASGLLFDFDSDVIRSAAASNLNALAQSVGKDDDTNLMIVGHTDNVGSDSYNQALSDRRAQAAATYLSSHGVSRHIATAGRGEREPIASNDTDEGRTHNRRVEIAIFASPELQERARSQAAGL